MFKDIPALVMPFLKPYTDAITRRGERPNEFNPAVDVFNQEKAYTIHVMLPGAKKQDIGIEWNAETSNLRISGVVHRPGDEELLKSVAHNESKVGYFARAINLGPKDKVRILKDDITAKLEAGILRITIPKDLKERKKFVKKIVVQGSSPISSDHEKSDSEIDVEARERQGKEKGKGKVDGSEKGMVADVQAKIEAEAEAEADEQADGGAEMQAHVDEDPEEELPSYEEEKSQGRSSDAEGEDWEDVKRIAVVDQTW